MAFGPWGVKAEEQAGKQKKHMLIELLGENVAQTRMRKGKGRRRLKDGAKRQENCVKLF